MSELTPSARHRGDYVPKHRVMRIFGLTVLTLTLVAGLFVTYTYRTINENLTVLDIAKNLGERPDKPVVEGPKEPLNVLIMGSDSRDGAGNDIDGLTGGGERSDTTIILHLSADRKHAYGVSLPRDAMVQRPDCKSNTGKEIPGGFAMWNVAFALGQESCTIKQVEQLTGIHIDHFVTVDFGGFKDMVDAINGVQVCIPQDVDDYVGNIHLKAGTRVVRGKEALDYVRVRHNISSNGDIGRMKRQQAFIAAMANKVVSGETLAHPNRLLAFAKAATKSVKVDPGLYPVTKMVDLAGQFKDIGLDNIKFITVPWDFYEPDPNRLVWAEDANLLWKKIKFDKPLSKRLSTEAISAAQKPGSTASPDPNTVPPTDDPTEEVTPDRQTEEERAESARLNGLCA